MKKLYNYKGYNKKYYLKSRNEVLKRQKDFKDSRRELINRYKTSPCKDCGKQYNPWVMDFDHREPENKSFSISAGICNSLDRIKEEILKCDLLCANCHRERTHKRKILKAPMPIKVG